MALSALALDGSQRPLEDEFTCAGVLRGALVALQPVVERVFGVVLLIGEEDTQTHTPHTHTPHNGLIWLKLRGSERDVEAAKIFVKGVVNQEAQQEIQFPEVLHCVFCGAKGLFMDCLIKSTSAHIVVGSQGFLLISGLAEPVVKAYSFVTDLVERYRSSQGRRSEAGLGIAGESLESRRAFKLLVENLEDRHTLDLLVLPVMVKEALLELVKQSGLNSQVKPDQEGPIPWEGNGSRSMQRSVDDHSAGNSRFQQPQSAHDRVNFPDDSSNESHSPFPHGFIPDSTRFESPESPERETEPETPAVLSSTGSREEFDHLLTFFTAMGFTEEVVHNVLARTGPKEASQILDLIQQEHDKTSQRKVGVTDQVREAQIPEASKAGEENVKEEDFVLGVLKKAAATCGYTEDRVMEVYGNLPELKPHELLMQLQKQEVKEPRNGSKRADWTTEPNSAADVEELDPGRGKSAFKQGTSMPSSASLVRGPPHTTYTNPQIPQPNTDPTFPNLSNPAAGPKSRASPHTTYINPQIPQPNTDPTFPNLSNHTIMSKPRAAATPHTTYTNPRIIQPNTDLTFPNLFNHAVGPKPRAAAASSVVTGPQRFLESLKTPFSLELSDEPGDPMLRQIIIDGSNVAMSHGLGEFFSCRGIALAVQHFWGRGHRQITVFIPQWRQKSNPRTKEKQYLTELHDLGFVSYTPSREFEGKRINSYDDRFMLALAQKTNGVIVTNDNLRDLVDESPAWREIIKKNLLQYVFAGDLFMLPDDPLGRDGPHLRDFLHKHNSISPAPGSHTFAGASSSSPTPPALRAHIEPLQYRYRTPGGRGSGRGQEVSERTVEETLKLQQSLLPMFPGQESVILMILQCHPTLRDAGRITDLILDQQE